MKLLRLAGAPGVGKSTTAWLIAQQLADRSLPTAYIDIDQLGMCYPAPHADPDRWALKEHALAAVAEEFRDAGADFVVVSGVARPDHAPPQIDGVATTSVWLDASDETRRARLDARALNHQELTRIVERGSAEAARVHPSWTRVDTDRHSCAETAAEVLSLWRRSRVRRVPGVSRSGTRHSSDPAGRACWITGPRLSGASRIGWEVVAHEWGRNRRAGFADLAQLSFTWNIDKPVGLANLRRLHEVFSGAGARSFVVVAPLDIDPEAAQCALGNSQLLFVRLATEFQDLHRNAASRRNGSGPVLAGDDLLGATDDHIALVIDTSLAQAHLPLRPGEILARTHGRTAAAVASEIRQLTGCSDAR